MLTFAEVSCQVYSCCQNSRSESPQSGLEDFLWGQGAPNSPLASQTAFVHCLLATNPFSNPGASYPSDRQAVLLRVPAPKP